MRPRLASVVRSVSALACVVALSTTGCASVQNVRTFRNHANEEPRVDVALDRTADLDALLALLDRLLTKIPVSAGDPWIDKLALTNDEARRLGEELRQKPPYSALPEQEIPIVKRYRVHLERVLDEAERSGKKPAEHPSLLAAVGAVGKDSGELATHWQAWSEQLRLAAETERGEANKDETSAAREAGKLVYQDVAAVKKKDGQASAALLASVTTAVSVAYRLQLEALALAPIVATQATRALPAGAKTLGEGTVAKLGAVTDLAQVPGHLGAIQRGLTRQTKLLDLLAHHLATASNVSLEATAGFALKESALSQVIGVTGESFHARARAGGEAFFFSALKQDDQSQSEDGKSRKDLTGRLRTLRYDVKPILLAAIDFDAGFDFGKITNALGLRAGFKTDRVFSSGGQVGEGSFAKQIGVSGAASDALDLGVGLLGVRTSVRLARFTTGTVTYTDAAGNDLVDAQGRKLQAPLTINFTQVDLGYDLAFLLGESAKAYAIEELVVGGRYFQYELPRILYELENQAPAGSESSDLRYVNESRPQSIPSTYYMGGVLARFGQAKGSVPAVAPRLSPFLDLGFYLGGGPTAYRLRKGKAVLCDPGQTDAGTNRECVDDLGGESGKETKSTAFAFDLAIALGLRLRLAQPNRRFRVSGELVYRAELIYANASTEDSSSGKQRQIDFGNADLFHGPRLNLLAEL